MDVRCICEWVSVCIRIYVVFVLISPSPAFSYVIWKQLHSISLLWATEFLKHRNGIHACYASKDMPNSAAIDYMCANPHTFTFVRSRVFHWTHSVVKLDTEKKNEVKTRKERKIYIEKYCKYTLSNVKTSEFCSVFVCRSVTFISFSAKVDDFVW